VDVVASIAGILAGLLMIAAYVPMILAVVHKKTSPNRASWLIWWIVSMVIYFSYDAAGGGAAVWVPLSYSIGSATIFILSLVWHGEGGWTRTDKRCLQATTISLVLWWLFNSPSVALLMNIVIDALGAIPTIRKVYARPESEDPLAWRLFLAGSLINLLAVRPWSFVSGLYPVMQVLIIGTIAGLVLVRWRPFVVCLPPHV